MSAVQRSQGISAWEGYLLNAAVIRRLDDLQSKGGRVHLLAWLVQQ